MQQQIALSGRSDCSVMEGEIGEEAKSSAHRSAGAGIIPASHNTRLPWRQTSWHAHSHMRSNTHTYVESNANIQAAVGNTSVT